MRRLTSQLLLLVLLCACQRREALTAAKAEEILRANMPGNEPVYAEVPQRVWWSPKSPKDDFDDKSVRLPANARVTAWVRNPSLPWS